MHSHQVLLPLSLALLLAACSQQGAPVGTANEVQLRSQAAAPLGPGGNWSLAFSDEFGGSSLDTGKWNTCYHWGCTNAGNNELQWYQAGNLRVTNGSLAIDAKKETVSGFAYTSGLISSHDKFHFKYGYAEARMDLVSGKGMWPAFWLLPRDGWPPEIDVIEQLGHEPNRTHHTVHWKDANGQHQSSGTAHDGPNFTAGFHTFGMEWAPDKIVWYVDGQEVKRYTDAANIPQVEMYLLANLAVGGNWPGSPEAGLSFPRTMSVDYIRVWKRAQSPVTSGSTYRLVNACSGKVLDVAGQSKDDGAKVHLWGNWNGQNQRWTAIDAGGGYFKFVAGHSGKNLDVAGAGTSNGTGLIQWPDNGNDAQRFKVIDAGNGYWALEPKVAPSKAVDISNSSTSDGAKVQIWTKNNSCAQKFKFETVGN